MKNKNIEVGYIVRVVNRVISNGQAKCRIIGQDLNGHLMKVAGVLEHRSAYLLIRSCESGPSGGYEVDERNVELLSA
jgi:hypothetical protein